MAKPRLIGIYAPCHRSGKGVIAARLSREHGYTNFKFADPLRDMFRTLARASGVSSAIVDSLLEELKHVAHPNIGVSYRTFAIKAGSECGRGFDPDFWVTKWERRVLEHITSWRDDDGYACCDDVRFPNEFKRVKTLGGEVWRVERPGFELSHSPLPHEAQLEGGVRFDRTLINDGTVADLNAQVDAIFSGQN